ncbi:unknown [[Mannheimia] succiniciproducens MBEL55E]|uniref:Uncharacterized protein n=1 Tax=Mannheimia succiniciproducens (strain KCTC 0769BP / MBEL55E) TaxID=221988 RepID=Q65RS2_MANSM|nr:unknown [[Mannheimia] succiniciproducens MBEL55E]
MWVKTPNKTGYNDLNALSVQIMKTALLILLKGLNN